MGIKINPAFVVLAIMVLGAIAVSRHLPEDKAPSPVGVEDPVKRAVLASCREILWDITAIERAVLEGEKLHPTHAKWLKGQADSLAMYPREEAVVRTLQAISHALRACEIAQEPILRRDGFSAQLSWARLNVSLARKACREQYPVTTP